MFRAANPELVKGWRPSVPSWYPFLFKTIWNEMNLKIYFHLQWRLKKDRKLHRLKHFPEIPFLLHFFSLLHVSSLLSREAKSTRVSTEWKHEWNHFHFSFPWHCGATEMLTRSYVLFVALIVIRCFYWKPTTEQSTHTKIPLARQLSAWTTFHWFSWKSKRCFVRD